MTSHHTEGKGLTHVKPPTLSVILPTYNAAVWLPDTLAKLRAALVAASWFDAEIIVVDDGSTDDTNAVLTADVGIPPITVVRQANGGRFRAREAGLRAAGGDSILFIDSRVHAGPDALRFLAQQLADHPDRRVWNGHVQTADGSSMFSNFWDGLTFLAWRRYFRAPQLTSYGIADYDYYPKGTTFFFAPREWLLEACDGFESSFDDLHNANDDTLMIRPIAVRSDIWLSPEFCCTYFPRDSARRFFAHTFHRGTVFVDGYYRPGTRFYRPIQALIVASPVAAVLALRRPLHAVLALASGGIFLGCIARVAGLPRRNARSLRWLSPWFAIAYGSGIARGVLLRNRSQGAR